MFLLPVFQTGLSLFLIIELIIAVNITFAIDCKSTKMLPFHPADG
jgi:hypothetical protein